MATKEQVFGILAAASGPMSRFELEDQVGESYKAFQTQLNRWVKQELVEDVGDHHYVLTEKGREEALQKTVFQEVDEHSEESLATTEYQQFIKLGKITGVVPLALIKQTADHVWEGGDYKDLKWVAQALQEMGIRKDLANRWFHSWRTKMNQPIPSDLSPDFSPVDPKKTEGKKEEIGGQKRDYILDEDDHPVYVGEGAGDLDYKDALDLAKVRVARRRDTAQPASAGSMADEVSKIFRAFKEVAGERAEGKSYVVKPAEDGYEIEEVEPNRPVLVPAPQSSRTGPSYYVDGDGAVKELNPGQPVVIIKEAPRPTSPSSHFLIDRGTGDIKEVAPGQPVVIIKESAPAPSQLTPIQMTDKDGNPMVLDLSTFIRLEEHRDKQRQQEESHQTKMDIAKSFKDMLNMAGRAAGRMEEEK